MKRSGKYLAVVASLFFLTATAFSNTVINWTDNATHWPGWPDSQNPSRNSIDAFGEPDITGGTIVISDMGLLQQVTFNFSTPPGWTFSLMYPGDLFLDTDSDGTWDYVVSLYNGNTNESDNQTRYQPHSPFSPAPVYSINLPLDGPASQGSSPSFGYLITGADNTGYWAGYLIRNDQPFAVTGLTSSNSTSLGNAVVSFTDEHESPLVFALDLSSTEIPISGPLTIGFTTNCANDVVYDTVTPIPEPPTNMLLGAGLILAAGVLRPKRR
jgi:hypothetical protein